MALRRPNFDLDISPFEIPEVAERLAKRAERFRAGAKKEADAPHALRLLRAHHQRPYNGRAAEKRDERATRDHSITSSARASSVRGTVRPSALAIRRLITSSNLVGAWTGRSP